MSVSGGSQHPLVSRRTAIQAGAIGLLGLGMSQLRELRAATPASVPTGGTAKSCIYIFLSGGLAQHESFDLKPDAPAEVRGEFKPISTKTPGIQICEHLPGLAERSRHFFFLSLEDLGSSRSCSSTLTMLSRNDNIRQNCWQLACEAQFLRRDESDRRVVAIVVASPAKLLELGRRPT